MDDSQCCRMCLSVQNLTHIFSMTEYGEKFTEIILTITGIKVQINDNLPKYICIQCTNFINECHKYRQKCQTIEKTLIEKFEQKPFCDVKEENTLPEFASAIDVNSDDFHDYDDNISLAEYHVKTEGKKPKKEPENTSKNIPQDKSTDSTVKFDHNLPKEVNVRRKYTKRKDVEGTVQEPRVRKKYVRKKITKQINTNLEENGQNGKSVEANGDMKTEENKYKCEFCPRVFTIKTAMHTHKKIHIKKVVCEHCGMRFPEPRRLLRHCRAKHGYEKTDKCSYCDYRGVDADQVKVHERTHTGEKPYVCAQCGASFSRSSSYHQHMDSHLPDKTVKCDRCPAKFQSVTLMRIHRNKHVARYTYACAMCDTQFTRRSNVVIHLRRIHSASDSGRVCDQCPQRFKSLTLMRIHRNVHANRYTYACRVCDNAFARRYNVVRHLRRIHSLKPDADNIVRRKAPSAAD